SSLFLLTHTTPTAICTLSLHDALPIFGRKGNCLGRHGSLRSSSKSGQSRRPAEIACSPRASKTPPIKLETKLSGPGSPEPSAGRSEEHTSELQSRENLVCRLLLEKKKK